MHQALQLIILCIDDLFLSDGQTARARSSPSVGNYSVDIKSFEQLALPTIKLNLNKSKVIQFTQNSTFLYLLCDRQLVSRAQSIQVSYQVSRAKNLLNV